MRKRMLKIVSMIFTVGIISGCMVGCGGASNTAPVSEDKTEVAPTETEVAQTETANEEPGELVLYSPAPEELLTTIIQEFQDETGIKVELIQAGSGELLTRVESESENPLADVLFGGGAESMEAYKEFFEAYESPEIVNVREEYRSSDNTWTGAYVSPTVIMYNKNLVSENEVPTGWTGFVDSKWKGKVAFADPVSSGSSFTTLSILLSAMDNGDGGWDYIRQYVDVLDGNLLQSSSAPHKGVSDGEYAMCITQEQAVLKYTEAGADYIGIVYPEEGTGAVPSAISVIKGAKNEENAKKFIDFILGKNVQNKLPEFLHRSVRLDVEENSDLTPMKDIKLADFDFLKASEEKDNYIEKWNDIVIGK